MSKPKQVGIYAVIPDKLKRSFKAQAITAGIDQQKFLCMAIEHYLECPGSKKEVEEILLDEDDFNGNE
jgi:hypothetical protein